ncbi:MAG: fructose-bisphosphate aldolase, partial [Deltaproteobacteria bacterium]|nr:fructose-bisphosphate aldolase [Deltaproteobacteria bacterium]
INKQGGGPWKLSFSYGRALQAAPLKAWAGNDDNLPAAQQALSHRARCNGAACNGEYSSEMEQAS